MEGKKRHHLVALITLVTSSGEAPTPASAGTSKKSSNIIEIWEWGICGLMGRGIYHLMGGAFMAYWVGHLRLNGWGIYIT